MKNKKVLTEEEYLSALGQILRRDYFPELEQLQAERDYLTAIEQRDLDALKNAIVRLDVLDPQSAEQDFDTQEMSLESFHQKYTSEDNQSFAQVLGRLNQMKRERFQSIHGATPAICGPPERRLLLAPSTVKKGIAKETEKKQIVTVNTRFQAPLYSQTRETTSFYIPPTPERDRTAHSLARTTFANSKRAQERLQKAVREASIRNSPFGGDLSTPRRRRK